MFKFKLVVGLVEPISARAGAVAIMRHSEVGRTLFEKRAN
jgi:hypothetical protein